MGNVQKVPQVVNLHLGTNHIANIEGLSNLTKIKALKLEHNQITKIEGLDSLVFLERLNLSDNFICRFQNLTNNKNQLIYYNLQDGFSRQMNRIDQLYSAAYSTLL